MRTAAALCHFYPGYTLATVRQLKLRDWNALIEFMGEATDRG